MTDVTHARDTSLGGRPTGATRARGRGEVGLVERGELRRSFGAVLWRERLGAGWTQDRLARAAGLSRRTIERYEAGRLRPSEVSTRRLAGALRAARPDVEVAALDLRLRRAAGASLLRVVRQRPERERWRRAYELARDRLEKHDVTTDMVAGAAVAALESVPVDPWAGAARRPGVR